MHDGTDTVASLQTRSVNNDMFLEACVENATKGPLVLEYMKFAATPPLTSMPVDTKRDLDAHQIEQGPLQQYMDTLQVGQHAQKLNKQAHMRHLVAQGLLEQYTLQVDSTLEHCCCMAVWGTSALLAVLPARWRPHT